MKRNGIIALTLFLLTTVGIAQDTSYVFKSLIDLETTSVKDQYRSGTCWSFSSLSFFESELIRLGHAPLDLSEMFIVRKCYEYKAEKYVRMHGETNFGGGGAFHDAFWVLENYGLMPETEYCGLNYGEEKHVHGEVDLLLKTYLDAVIANKNKKLSKAWFKGYEGILDAYFGEVSDEIEYEGKSYTAQTFAESEAPLKADDYVSLTSYTHHPFYSSFVLEIPDNWLWRESYNMPLEELMDVFISALEGGYTIAWGGDVSEKGFSHKKGIAIVPDKENPDLSDSERSKWENLSQKEKDKKLYQFKKPVKEKLITQALRQEGFDNYQTTDDHGMHITGLVEDQHGTIYYKVKNSWNTDNTLDGYIYMSQAFMEYKTMNIVVHKDAIPKSIRKKLNL